MDDELSGALGDGRAVASAESQQALAAALEDPKGAGLIMAISQGTKLLMQLMIARGVKPVTAAGTVMGVVAGTVAEESVRGDIAALLNLTRAAVAEVPRGHDDQPAMLAALEQWTARFGPVDAKGGQG